MADVRTRRHQCLVRTRKGICDKHFPTLAEANAHARAEHDCDAHSRSGWSRQPKRSTEPGAAPPVVRQQRAIDCVDVVALIATYLDIDGSRLQQRFAEWPAGTAKRPIMCYLASCVGAMRGICEVCGCVRCRPSYSLKPANAADGRPHVLACHISQLSGRSVCGRCAAAPPLPLQLITMAAARKAVGVGRLVTPAALSVLRRTRLPRRSFQRFGVVEEANDDEAIEVVSIWSVRVAAMRHGLSFTCPSLAARLLVTPVLSLEDPREGGLWRYSKEVRSGKLGDVHFAVLLTACIRYKVRSNSTQQIRRKQVVQQAARSKVDGASSKATASCSRCGASWVSARAEKHDARSCTASTHVTTGAALERRRSCQRCGESWIAAATNRHNAASCKAAVHTTTGTALQPRQKKKK